MFPAGAVVWYWAKWPPDKTMVNFFFLRGGFSMLGFEASHTRFGLACIIATSCTVHL